MTAQGTFDALRISDRERSAEEIVSYRNTILAAAPEPGTLPLLRVIGIGAYFLSVRKRRADKQKHD